MNKKLEEMLDIYCKKQISESERCCPDCHKYALRCFSEKNYYGARAYVDGYLAHQKEAEGLKSFIESLDQYFCERIIDPCGFDPEKESKEDLIKLVKTLSEDNNLQLTNLRCWLKKYESGGEG